MKRINIVPFREFWQDCFNCIVYSLIGNIQDVPKLYYYNNMYKYNFTDETASESGIKYKSVVPWTDNFRLFTEITKNREKINFQDIKNPIQFIKNKIDEEKIVLLGVDLYYWIYEGFHYMKTHLMHQALVIGYDDDAEELIVLETSNELGYAEHRVDYERAEKAVKSSSILTSVSEINRTACVKMYTKEDVSFYAKQIVDSLEEKLINADKIWKIDGLTENDLKEMILILSTHLYSFESRAHINAYMFENTFDDDSIQGSSLHEKFYEIEREYESMKNICIKMGFSNEKYQKIMNLKNKMVSLLEKEKSLWKFYIEHFNEMKMK